MSRSTFYQVLQQEIDRIDAASVSKRTERVIEGFVHDGQNSPRALIAGKEYRIFNSNDYLGLRHHRALKKAEVAASETYGAGPGAVRFISGSLKVHEELEHALAAFHGREAGMVFSSAFATNMGVLFSLLRGQNKDSKLQDNPLVISDELNHRSIIDGIRVANMGDAKAIFKHLDPASLREVLAAHVGKYDRVLVVTDGVFSMLGEIQKLKELRAVVDEFDAQYPNGVLLVVDDAHGVAACGATGRGTEEVCGVHADVLIGTLGKGFGADGGYVVADHVVINYLRESAATYIYSNGIPPATAGAALASVELLTQAEGHALVTKVTDHIAFFKEKMKAAGFQFAADSMHPVQPLLIGDAAKSKALTDALFAAGYLVTNLSYPVVTKGRDEIRIQLSAAHSQADVEAFIAAVTAAGKQTGVIA